MPTFDVDVYKANTMKGKPIAKTMWLIIRCQNPYRDTTGVLHPGTHRGIKTWFHKRNFALSGKASATISAKTAVSHALAHSDPSDWVGTTPKKGITRQEANLFRAQEGTRIKASGDVFVGNPFHKLGQALGLGVPTTYALKKLVADHTGKKLREMIWKMADPIIQTHPSVTIIDAAEVSELVRNCLLLDSTGGTLPGNIETVSDLFAEVTQIIAPRI